MEGKRRTGLETIARAFLPLLIVATASAGLAKAECPQLRGRWKIVEFSLSPDGTRLAELVAVTQSGRGIDRIVVRELQGKCGYARELYSASALSNMHWLSNGRIAFAVSGRKDQIDMLDVRTGAVTVLVETPFPVADVLPEPGGRLVAYLYVATGEIKWRDGSVKVTDDMGVFNVVAPNWVPRLDHERYHVGIVGWDGGRDGKRRQWVFQGAYYPPDLAWSGTQLFVNLASESSWLSSVYEVTTGKLIGESRPLIISDSLAVSPGGLIAAVSFGHVRSAWMGEGRIYIRNHQGIVRSVPSVGQPYIYATHVWWQGENALFSQVLTEDAAGGARYWELARFSWRTGRVREYRWTGGSLGSPTRPCTLDILRTSAVCVAQSLTQYPRLVDVNLGTGRMRELGYMASDGHDLNLRFREISIVNAYGQRSTGFLATPAGDEGRAVPLAVALYGFYRVFSRNAQWITSYPVARMVHAGIAVLLLEFPDAPNGVGSDFAQTKMSFLDGPLATVAAVRSTLARDGVPVSRAMVMGWSHGGLIAAHAIQRVGGFVAAEVGDPAWWISSAYGAGNRWWREFMNTMFGGPPDLQYVGHYLQFDPVADGKAAKGPILFEFVSTNLAAGQYLEEWRAAGTQVEAFAYHHSMHVLTVPEEAEISRERNLDWAKLNLLGPKSVSAAELRRVGLTLPANGWWTRGKPDIVPAANGAARGGTEPGAQPSFGG